MRKCACGCGRDLPVGSTPRRVWFDSACAKRGQRAGRHVAYLRRGSDSLPDSPPRRPQSTAQRKSTGQRTYRDGEGVCVNHVPADPDPSITSGQRRVCVPDFIGDTHSCTQSYPFTADREDLPPPRDVLTTATALARIAMQDGHVVTLLRDGETAVLRLSARKVDSGGQVQTKRITNDDTGHVSTLDDFVASQMGGAR